MEPTHRELLTEGADGAWYGVTRGDPTGDAPELWGRHGVQGHNGRDSFTPLGSV